MADLHDSPIQADLLDGTLNGYQKAALSTAIYPGRGTFWGLCYTTIKSAGEVGEFSDKIGKMMRDDGWMPNDKIKPDKGRYYDKKRELALELGDELWYLAAKADELGYTLDTIAEMNIRKLQDRQKRGTLSGSGDNR